MKRIVLIIAIFSSLMACKKTQTQPSATIFGKWELRRVYGGFIQPPDSTYQPGNGNILQFNNDSTYKQYANGNMTLQGVFHVRKNYDSMSQKTNVMLYFDNSLSGSVITLSSQMLTIQPLVPDIGTTQYARIQN